MARVIWPIFAAIGVANAAIQLTTTGCSDPSGLQTCLNGVTETTSACLNKADADASQLETLACGCVNYVESYNCYSSHCWNRVNECEYQSYIVEYLVTCPTAATPIPYFPTPKGAPDACSCNLGEVYLAISDYIEQGGTCSQQQSGGDISTGVQRLQGCLCCEVSGALSSIYGLCPTTDPTLIGLAQVQQVETTLNTPFDSCTPYLSEYACDTDLKFPAVAGGTFYNANNFPATGTATLSNVPGTVTAPASGSVFTYTNGGDHLVYTITAVGGSGSDNAAAQPTGSDGSGSSGGSGTSGGSGGSGGSGTGTASGGSAAPTKTNLAGRVSVKWGLLCSAGLIASLMV